MFKFIFPINTSRDDANPTYSLIGEKPDNTETDSRGDARLSLYRKAVLIIATTVITSIVWTFGLYLFQHYKSTICLDQIDNYSSATSILHCGNSTAEARILGCKYDPLTVGWVPAPCFNDAEIQEYMSLTPWMGSRDRQGTQILSLDEMSEEPYWTTIREHVVHCALIWRRLHWGLDNGWRITDDVTRSYGHTKHCTAFLLKYVGASEEVLNRYFTKNYPWFSSCRVDNGSE
ncbi:hypothetical protein F5884DRAFT_667748 [Xylogone sp. PMI_703]|nr:hypothetical protein F5884DRAFT_667748 [Xylogone sp. PMI_703]